VKGRWWHKRPVPGLQPGRNVAAIAGGFVAALALARGTDLVACVPERHTENLRDGLHTFALPFATPELSIAMFWHPRFQGDGGQGWFRGVVGRFVVGCVYDWSWPGAEFGQPANRSITLTVSCVASSKATEGSLKGSIWRQRDPIVRRHFGYAPL
jgi:hypothetical protein